MWDHPSDDYSGIHMALDDFGSFVVDDAAVVYYERFVVPNENLLKY